MSNDFIRRDEAIAEIKADAGCDFCCLKMAGRCLTCSAGRKIRRIEALPPAYEDTGVTVDQIRDAHSLIADAIKANDRLTGRRLDEILVAEAEDRLLISSCKVGDTVWDRNVEPWNVISVEWFSKKVTQLHCVSPVTAAKNTFSIGKRSLGKTVFLTREEAEAARKEANDG